MPEIPVILNPRARSASAASRIDQVLALPGELKIHETREPEDAENLARDLAESGAPIVVAAGGDGTINGVVNGMATAAVEKLPTLGVLPFGTMNVFSLELGLPKNLDRAWEIICAGKTRDIDLWRGNEHFFVQLAGVGLDAEIIRETTWEQKKQLGPLSYVISAARIIGKEAPEVTVIPNGHEPVSGSLVLIGNGKRYGGPLKIFPTAEIDDQMLDVLVFQKLGYVEILDFLKSALVTGFDGEGDFSYFRTSGLRVESQHSVPFEVDGDCVDTTPVTFRLARRALSVLVG